MRIVKLTRTKAGAYDGDVFLNMDNVLFMQRLGDATDIASTTSRLGEDDEGFSGGCVGIYVAETPEQILALLKKATE